MSNREAILLVALPLVFLKVWATALVLIHQPTREAVLSLFGVFGWPWIVVCGLLVMGPLAAWLRLVRVRAKRERLRRAEWMGRQPGDVGEAPTPAQWPLWETVSRLERGGS